MLTVRRFIAAILIAVAGAIPFADLGRTESPTTLGPVVASAADEANDTYGNIEWP